MDIRVWRVSAKEHSTVFDDFDVAVRFLRGGFGSGEWKGEDLVSLESETMSEEEYKRLVEEEDGVKTFSDREIAAMNEFGDALEEKQSDLAGQTDETAPIPVSR